MPKQYWLVGPVDYSTKVAPDGYVCAQCGETHVKLWREWENDKVRLLCAPCAGADQGKDVSGLDAMGMQTIHMIGTTDQIGYYVPAVPKERGGGYWGYCLVPEAGQKWWQELPTFPQRQ